MLPFTISLADRIDTSYSFTDWTLLYVFSCYFDVLMLWSCCLHCWQWGVTGGQSISRSKHMLCWRNRDDFEVHCCSVQFLTGWQYSLGTKRKGCPRAKGDYTEWVSSYVNCRRPHHGSIEMNYVAVRWSYWTFCIWIIYLHAALCWGLLVSNFGVGLSLDFF